MTEAATLVADRYPLRNQSGLPDQALAQDPQVREIARQLSSWVENSRAATNRSTLFDRGAYVAPDNVFEQMRVARTAVANDDVVGGVADVTEAFAFQGVKWECQESDEADVFNQMAQDLDLDSLVRKMWREEFTYSQVVYATWWGSNTYKVRGKTKNDNARKRSFSVYAPTAVTILDSTKVIPVGSLAFGMEKLAWRASKGEMDTWDGILTDQVSDPLMQHLFLGQYHASESEKEELGHLGVDVERLLLFNPQFVHRHTLTRPDYDRWAEVHLKSVFRHLDLKQQLMESDRVNLIGAANYILLVRKGLKDEPAQQPEIDNLNENFRFLAKLPVIVSDHRLTIDIITPKTDFTLVADRYEVVDGRIRNRLLGSISGTGKGQRNETSLTVGRSVARVMENRRHMLRRSIEANLCRAVIDHPLNVGVFKDQPSLAFSPRNVALDIEDSLVQAILAARTNGEISRETFLEQLGFDEAIEANRRRYEDEMYDGVFTPIAIPFSSPALTPQASGAAGGRPTGGGSSSQNSTQAKGKSASGNTRT